MAAMIVFPQYERFVWFHRRLKERRFPNANHLKMQFEISTRTASRDIFRLRYECGAPIEYDYSKKGYYYTDESYELPQFPATQEEILALLIARRLLSVASGGFLGEAIRSFSESIRDAAAAFGLDEARLEEAFSASWHGYSPASDAVFRPMVHALIERRPVEIEYYSPGLGANTRRIVEPHHLQYYMASWVLVAYCRLREGWRKFYLSRIERMNTLPETFDPRPREHWEPQLEGAFGIFRGPEPVPVVLRFNAFRARWIREQVWHPAQEVRPTPDGGVDLCFPVSDFREVKMMILQFGADVRVIEPEVLRDVIRKEIAEMAEVYRCV